MVPVRSAEQVYQLAVHADARGDGQAARTLYAEAADKGFNRAIVPYAAALIEGRGGPVDPLEAFSRLCEIESSDPTARRMMSAALILQDSGPAGWRAALDRRVRHAQSGDREAGFEIAMLLQQALPEHPAAVALLTQAAANGSGAAIAALVRRASETGHTYANTFAHLDRLSRVAHPLVGPLRTAVKQHPVSQGETQTIHQDVINLDEIGAALSETIGQPAPPGQTLNSAPRIVRHHHIFTRTTCDYLAASAWPMLRRSRIFDPNTGVAREDVHRRAYNASISAAMMDLPFLHVYSRMAALSGCDIDLAEPLSILLYHSGDEYRAHFDFFAEDGAIASAEIASRGQRKATTLLSLNSEYEGGHTHFNRLNLSWRGEAGDALSFDNLTGDGEGDPQSLHSGGVVTSGWKALASLWLRERPVGPSGLVEQRASP